MKRASTDGSTRILCLLALGFVGSLAGGQSKSDLTEPVQHQYVLKNFQTESGIVLPEATIVYGTYGKLDANGDNAVLLPSHYMADMHGYEWLIGVGGIQYEKAVLLRMSKCE